MRCKRNILVLSCLDFWRNKLCLKIFGIPAQVLSDFERSRVQKYLSSYGHWRPNLLVVDSFFGIDVVTSSWATIIFWIGSKTPMAMVPCWVFPCWLHYVGFRMVVLRDWDVFKMPGMACQHNRSWFEWWKVVPWQTKIHRFRSWNEHVMDFQCQRPWDGAHDPHDPDVSCGFNTSYMIPAAAAVGSAGPALCFVGRSVIDDEFAELCKSPSCTSSILFADGPCKLFDAQSVNYTCTFNATTCTEIHIEKVGSVQGRHPNLKMFVKAVKLCLFTLHMRGALRSIATKIIGS